MRAPWWIVLAVSGAFAQSLPDDHVILDDARQHALGFVAKLPDFICSQSIRRLRSGASVNAWRQIDLLLLKLNYVNRNEDYQLLSINNRRTNESYEAVIGHISRGEFGSWLEAIFNPETAAEFQFDSRHSVRGREAAVFAYKVDKKRSHYDMIYRQGPHTQLVAIGYHGRVYIDLASHQVTRLDVTADGVPKEFPFKPSSIRIEYGFTDIAGRQYLLPRYAETLVSTSRTRFRNQIEFRDYRKFEAEALLRFSDGKKVPSGEAESGTQRAQTEPKPDEAAASAENGGDAGTTANPASSGPPPSLKPDDVMPFVELVKNESAELKLANTSTSITQTAPAVPDLPPPEDRSADQRRENKPAAFDVSDTQIRWNADEVRSTNSVYILPPGTTLRVESNLVDVGVVVRDAHGRAVGGLQREDFLILDGGKEQAVTAFSLEAAPAGARSEVRTPSAPNPPRRASDDRSVVLYFDDLSIVSGDLARVKVAASRFVNEALDPGDQVALMTSSGTPFLDFTEETGKVLEVIAKLRAHPRMSENGLSSCPRITPYQAYLIINGDTVAQGAALDEAYVCEHGSQRPPGFIAMKDDPAMSNQIQAQAEATWAQARGISHDTLDAIGAAVDRLTKAPGSRMLVLASSGFLSSTLDAEQDRIVDRALRANIVIHALDAKGRYTDKPRSGATIAGGDLPLSTFMFEQTSAGSGSLETAGAMAKLAESTGGLFLRNRNDLDAGLRSLIPEFTYRLGFVPSNPADGKYHSLKIRLTHPESNHVLARPGYFAAARKSPDPPPDQRRPIDREVESTDTLSQLPVSIIAEPREAEVRVALTVDVRRLNFAQKDSRHVEKLSFVAALFDESGQFISGKQGELSLALTDETYARLVSTGLSTAISVHASPGAYRLRGVVEDSKGNVLKVTQAVQIP
jgi:VWFA-related protein